MDYGEKKIVLQNAASLASLGLQIPIVYAGNAVIRKPINEIFDTAGIETLLADNVFPEVDVLNIEPVRYLIQQVFNRHIIHGPGMSRLDLTDHQILPTPGAVLHAAELFAEALGDCLVLMGGATTDVHSVSEGSRVGRPPDRARTVCQTYRGRRLGVYVNARNIIEMAAVRACITRSRT